MAAGATGAGDRWRSTATTARSIRATPRKTSVPPVAPGRDSAAASGSTGWTTSSAANHGTVSRLSRA
ncbi:hypothetical protein ACQP1S_26305 [Micromonospora matsumotoense]|uniref:hypothetical protein n=1 Tax=Micromonospora matsumotoense TaxID=121616 RepID=UPI003D93AD75